MNAVRKALREIQAWMDRRVRPEPSGLPVLKDPPVSKDLPASKGSKAPKGRKGK